MEEQLHWYALKVFYNKVFDLEFDFRARGIESYIPVEKVLLKGEDHLRAARRLAVPDDLRHDNRYIQTGPLIFLRKTIVNSLMFVHTSEEGIAEIMNDIRGRGFVYMTSEREAPAIIPDKQMKMFQMVTSSGVEGLVYFSDEDMTRYKQGDHVRVLEGPFKGAEGYIKRIRRDRRLLVAIEGFIAVATSFIPMQFLEVIPEK